MKNILIADDENAVSRSLALVLKKNGFRVKQAANGVQALYLIKAALKADPPDPFDLIIIDLYMPGLNGMELIDELHNIGIHVLTMIITGYGERGEVIDAIRKGCSEFITKPFNKEIIISAINRVFEKQALNEFNFKKNITANQDKEYKVEKEKILRGLTNSINDINGALRLIVDTSLSAEQEKLFEVIENSVKKLDAIVTDHEVGKI